MNILWIPHIPASPGAHRRDQYFIRHLKERHRFFTLTWQTWKGVRRPSAFWDGLRFYPLMVDDLDAFHVRRLPDFMRRFRKQRFKTSSINQYFFQRDIRSIVTDQAIDLVITGPTSFLTGFPPSDLPVPLIFDYLDCGDWEADPDHPEMAYLHEADAVLCVSSLALERTKPYGKPCLFLPNGADIARMRAASGAEVRRKYGLEGAKVVSLIGLTCSPRLYFLEAVERARRQVPELKCLLVGKSPEIEAALKKRPGAADTFIYAGAVPYEDIAGYFAASDVGMYPVDEKVYYHGASPIKIFEYTAAGKPVVVPRIREAERLGFDNFVFTRPDAESYAEGIVRALRRASTPVQVPDIGQYDWAHLAEELDAFLEQVAGSHTPQRTRTRPVSLQT